MIDMDTGKLKYMWQILLAINRKEKTVTQTLCDGDCPNRKLLKLGRQVLKLLNVMTTADLSLVKARSAFFLATHGKFYMYFRLEISLCKSNRVTLGQVSFPTIITLDQKSITDINLENLQGHGNTTCFS